ncbi:MAG: hotdog fold thioesterase [Cyclobacteriaceae bacterium]
MSSESNSNSTGFLRKDVTLDELNALSANTLVEHLGIRFSHIGPNYVSALMPVDNRTHQPLGLLHGGASVALAETLGSIAATLCVDPKSQYCVGLEINANHVRAISSGFVKGTASPLHIGKRTHVWEIKIVNEKEELISISRITMAVIDRR